jgi:ubiquinol-cytochrome c reductase cytochrome b subunit
MYGLFWAAGGNDIIAIRFDLGINQITYFMRGAVFVGPVISFMITRRWCISLQRKDIQDLLHGYESGIIMRSPEGGYTERHLPLSPERAYKLTARDRDPEVLGELPGGPDANGVEPPSGGIGARLAGLRQRIRKLMYADNVQKPTAAELEEGHHHAEHEHELQAPMEGHAADGHQFDGHHLVEGEKLRADD